jgi:4-diphosphocytidyl-2-C-methyl-D-erythritol kinase
MVAAEAAVSASLTDRAPAKVNLSLRVLGRRADGYHELESLVAFADAADALSLSPGEAPALVVEGAYAAACGDVADNLVWRAAQALAARVAGLRLGRFTLDKQLPVAAGIGGGSADAAAALRLLARAGGLAGDDPRLAEAARALGADVSICLDPVARTMRGIGHDLSPPLRIAPLPAVLVNPGVAVSTREIFSGLAPESGRVSHAETAPAETTALLAWLQAQRNDLEAPALARAPVIGAALDALHRTPGVQLARMSGSGATCFALFAHMAAAQSAAQALTRDHPQWWVRATTLR